MKKTHLVLLVTVIAGLILMPSFAPAKTVLKMGFGDPIDSDQGAYAKQFKYLMEGYTNGEVEIQLFPGSALGTETEMLQNTRRGALDLSMVAVTNMTPFSKELNLLTMPYVIKSMRDAVNITTGALGHKFNNAAIKQAGVRILGYTYSNFRHLTNSKREVKRMADLKGLKIRVPQNKPMLETYKAWGANPTPMAWPEVFTALQQGVIDGQDNPHIVNYTMKFQEVQDHITALHYIFSLQPLIVGEKYFQALDPEMQDLLIRAGIEAQQFSMLFQVEESNKALNAMIDSGMTYNKLEDEDKMAQIAQEKVWPQFYDAVGGKKALESLIAELETAKEGFEK
jgi:tripartite ATP-independent transporter DctP family solute receptor